VSLEARQTIGPAGPAAQLGNPKTRETMTPFPPTHRRARQSSDSTALNQNLPFPLIEHDLSRKPVAAFRDHARESVTGRSPGSRPLSGSVPHMRGMFAAEWTRMAAYSCGGSRGVGVTPAPRSRFTSFGRHRWRRKQAQRNTPCNR